MCKHNLFWKSIYNRQFHKVFHKGGYSAIKYIERFKYAKALSVSMRNSYSEDQLMHNFLDYFQKGGGCSAQIAIHQEELRRKEKLADQEYLSLSAFQINYLDLDNSIRSTERETFDKLKWTNCGVSCTTEKCFKHKIKWKGNKTTSSSFNSIKNIGNECNNINPNTCFMCVSEDHCIAYFQNQKIQKRYAGI